MGWFDNIKQGAGKVADWFGSAGGGKGQQQAPAAPAPAAPAAKQEPAKEQGWGDSWWAKATGLAPWAKALGAGQTPADPSKAAAPKATGGGAANKKGYEGGWQKKKEGFGRDTEKGGFKTPEYQKWKAAPWSKTYGNRESDHELDKDGNKIAKNKAEGAPKVWQPTLDKIGNSDPNKPGYDPRSTGYNNRSGVLDKGDAESQVDKTGQAYSDSGSFRSSKYGSYSGKTGLLSEKYDEKTGGMVNDPQGKFTVGHNGKGSMGIAGWEGQWGAEEKGGWRSTGVSADKLTQHQVEAGWVASGGASGSYGLDTAKGAYAQGGVGGKVGAYAQGDWDTKTNNVKVGGVDYNAGIGVHGDAFVGAKAGASGEIGLGPDFIGAKGDIGAFAGAELQGDVHGNLGPLGAKAGGSLMAGAGIGAEGELSYKDGKIHVGGKLFAALGYGGSLSADLTIDVGAMGRTIGNAGAALGEGAANLGSAALSVGGDILSGAGNAVSAVLSW